MAKRRKRRKTKSLVLNKYKVWVSMIVLWWLYFFSLYLAQGSPILEILTSYASVAFGKIWLNIFFGLSVVVWTLILTKAHLMRILIKQFVAVMFLVSALLNFNIIDGIESRMIEYQDFWWYISWPLIQLLDVIFWGQAIAIKVFIILLFIWVISRILYTFNVSVPKIKLWVESYNKPSSSKKIKKAAKSSNEDVRRAVQQVSTNNHKKNEADDMSKTFLKSLIKQKVDQKLNEKTINKQNNITFSADKPTFHTSLLESNASNITKIDETFLVEKAQSLKNKLMEFNVPVSIEGFDVWPTIMQVRIKPQQWIRVSSIENLSNDIKLSMRSKSLRIIAPIPGTDSVGIQLPNPKPSMVRLGDIMWSQEFQSQIRKVNTTLALGKQIDGSIIVKDLESMPHLLVAGATGSGKSVGVNDFILSLMYQNSPSELKFLMVDPKQVELELYSWLPYMLWPIVSDPDKALKLLKRAVDEMEHRYGLLKSKRVRNIDEYNKKLIGDNKLFRIVIVIDELADMMMHKNKKDVETCITRIAQKARAIGIHLIVATQRPSVNVITGLIKANIPTRIAFGVVSEIDSRTILWRKWAEDLVGKWDMLYTDPNTKFPIRIQAPFVSTEEIEKIVSKLKDKYMQWLSEEDIYNPEILQALEWKLETMSWSFSGWSGDDEELIQQAIQVIAQTRKASATLLQRKLNVGFARAARIMDQLEERGIVWPQDGAKPREIFI